jgi:hypothetical protein
MKIYPLLLLLAACFLMDCGRKQGNTCASGIDSISVAYYNYEIYGFKRRTREDLSHKRPPTFKRYYSTYDSTYQVDYTGTIDTCITDCEALLKIEEALKTLKPGYHQAFNDLRAIATIYFKDVPRVELDMSALWPSDIFRDGELMETNLPFLYLIRLFSGYYTWCTKEELWTMPEVRDSTFARDYPIVMTYETNPRVKPGGN